LTSTQSARQKDPVFKNKRRRKKEKEKRREKEKKPGSRGEGNRGVRRRRKTFLCLLF